MNKKTRELKRKLLRKHPYCGVCATRLATDLHHCIERRRKGHPELDCVENLEPVCNPCHISGYANTTEHTIEFVKRQISRGYDILGWYEKLNLRTRRFPNLRGMV